MQAELQTVAKPNYSGEKKGVGQQSAFQTAAVVPLLLWNHFLG